MVVDEHGAFETPCTWLWSKGLYANESSGVVGSFPVVVEKVHFTKMWQLIAVSTDFDFLSQSVRSIHSEDWPTTVHGFESSSRAQLKREYDFP